MLFDIYRNEKKKKLVLQMEVQIGFNIFFYAPVFFKIVHVKTFVYLHLITLFS
jgi:hypothetical protein